MEEKYQMKPEHLRTSLIVPVLNEREGLPGLLRTIERQTVQPNEIILADGGSTDGTLKYVEALEDPRIQLVHNASRRVPNGLNKALEAATGDIVVRVDAHSRLSENYIEIIESMLREEPKLGGAGGVKIAVAETKMGKAIAAVLSSKLGVGSTRYHYASDREFVDHIPFGAYRRSVLEELEGWNTKFPVNQDYELDFRVRQTGRGLLLDPNARIYWSCKETLSDFFKQYRRYGQGKFMVACEHPSSIKPQQVAPAAAVLVDIGAVLAFAVLRDKRALIVPATHLSFAVAAGSIVESGFRDRLNASLAIFAMQTGHGIGFLRQAVRHVSGDASTVEGSQGVV